MNPINFREPVRGNISTRSGYTSAPAATLPPKMTEGAGKVDALQKFLWGALIVSFPFTALELWPDQLKTFGEPSVLLAGLLGCLVVAEAVLRPSRIYIPKGRSAWLLVALVLVIGLSFFVNHPINPYMWPGHNPWTKSAKQITQWFVDGWIVYLTLRFVRTWSDFRFALKYQFWGLLAVLGSAFLELAASRYPAGTMASLYQGLHNGGMEQAGSRLSLLAYEPSMAGDYLLAVLPLLVCGSFYWKSRWWMAVWSAVAIVLFCGTFSFGCFGALFAAALIVGVVYARRGSKGLVVGVLLLLLMIVTATVTSSGGEEFLGGRISEIFESGLDPDYISNFSTRQRLANVEAAFNVFLEHPLLGVGAGKSGFYIYSSYPVWALHQSDITGLSRGPTTLPISYNMFVVMLSETGLVGTAIFVALLISMLADCYGAMNKAMERWKRAVFAGILFAFVAQIIHYNAMSWLGMRYWFFIWGLAICAPKLLDQKDPRMPVRRVILSKAGVGFVAPSRVKAVR